MNNINFSIEHRENLIKVLFKKKGITAENIPAELIDKWWPEFSSMIDKLYDSYDATLYDVFIIEWEDGGWICSMGFDVDEESEEDEVTYGVIDWTVNEEFEITYIDWYTD